MASHLSFLGAAPPPLFVAQDVLARRAAGDSDSSIRKALLCSGSLGCERTACHQALAKQSQCSERLIDEAFTLADSINPSSQNVPSSGSRGLALGIGALALGAAILFGGRS